jgi:hypothetical protein
MPAIPLHVPVPVTDPLVARVISAYRSLDRVFESQPRFFKAGVASVELIDELMPLPKALTDDGTQEYDARDATVARNSVDPGDSARRIHDDTRSDAGAVAVACLAHKVAHECFERWFCGGGRGGDVMSPQTAAIMASDSRQVDLGGFGFAFDGRRVERAPDTVDVKVVGDLGCLTELLSIPNDTDACDLGHAVMSPALAATRSGIHLSVRLRRRIRYTGLKFATQLNHVFLGVCTPESGGCDGNIWDTATHAKHSFIPARGVRRPVMTSGSEDARLVSLPDDSIAASFTHFMGAGRSTMHLLHTPSTTRGLFAAITRVALADAPGAKAPFRPVGGGEKNWGPLVHNDVLHFVCVKLLCVNLAGS